MKYYNVPSDFQLSDSEALALAYHRISSDNDDAEETVIKREEFRDNYDGLTFSQNCVQVTKSWSELVCEL